MSLIKNISIIETMCTKNKFQRKELFYPIIKIIRISTQMLRYYNKIHCISCYSMILIYIINSLVTVKALKAMLEAKVQANIHRRINTLRLVVVYH